jgi:tetratricopeptide (TPR) repeat protein
LSNIPRTQKDRKELERQRNSDQFKLGNLFFLDLQKPDSAAYYYHLALDGIPPKQMKSRTLYTLYKLYQSNHQPDSAIAYKQKIFQMFPSSIYAKQIVNRTGRADTLKYSAGNSNGKLLSKVRDVLEKKQGLSNKKTALKLQKLAMKYRDDTTASALYLKGIRRYIKYAKEKDSSRVEIDSLKANSGSNHSYEGKYWDHVRSMLEKFTKMFPNARQQEQVNIWLSMLKSSQSGNKIRSCKELGIRPKIIGGKKEFLQSVKMPDKVKGVHISGKIRFKLMIQKDGSVRSIQLMSRPTNLGIEPAYVHAIRESLQFKPVEVNGKKVKVSCIVSFPIKSE